MMIYPLSPDFIDPCNVHPLKINKLISGLFVQIVTFAGHWQELTIQ